MGKNIQKICCILTVLLLFQACTKHGNDSSILPPETRLEAGDLVLRRGNGLVSRAVLAVDRGCTYSHIGMVVDSGGMLMIAHAVQREPDFDGDKDRVKLETADNFFASDRALAGCILRCKDAGAAKAASRKALELYEKGTLFDHLYDSQDPGRMYCSEFIEYAYSSAGRPLAAGKRHDIHLPGITLRNVILPSDFLKSPYVRCVSRFQGRGAGR